MGVYLVIIILFCRKATCASKKSMWYLFVCCVFQKLVKPFYFLLPFPNYWWILRKQVGLFHTERWGDFNSKQLPFEKFLQNPFLGCQWSPWRGKIIWSAVESFYLMIWTKFQWRNLQSIRKLLRENWFLKILCSGFYCTDNYFSFLETPLAS